MLNQQTIESLGDELYEALRSGQSLPPLTDRENDIQIEDAYHISQRMVSLRVELDGEKIIGKKSVLQASQCRKCSMCFSRISVFLPMQWSIRTLRILPLKVI